MHPNVDGPKRRGESDARTPPRAYIEMIPSSKPGAFHSRGARSFRLAWRAPATLLSAASADRFRRECLSAFVVSQQLVDEFEVDCHRVS